MGKAVGNGVLGQARGSNAEDSNWWGRRGTWAEQEKAARCLSNEGDTWNLVNTKRNGGR